MLQHARILRTPHSYCLGCAPNFLYSKSFHSHATSIEMDRFFNRHVLVVRRRTHSIRAGRFFSLYRLWAHVADKRHVIEMDVHSMRIVSFKPTSQWQILPEMFFQHNRQRALKLHSFLWIRQTAVDDCAPNLCFFFLSFSCRRRCFSFYSTYCARTELTHDVVQSLFVLLPVKCSRSFFFWTIFFFSAIERASGRCGTRESEEQYTCA